MKRDFRPPRPVRSRPAQRHRAVTASSPRGRFLTVLAGFGRWLGVVVTAILLMLVAIATIGYLWLTGQERLSTVESLLVMPADSDSLDQPGYWLAFSPTSQSIRVIEVSSTVEPQVLAFKQHSPTELTTMVSYAFGRLLTRPPLPAASHHLESRRELEQYFWQLMTQPNSHLSRKEAFLLWSFVREVPDLNTQFQTVRTSAELERQLGLLGSMVPDKNCTIAVVNSTGTPGVAARVGKVIERSGGVVINLNDTPAPQAVSRILMVGESGSCGATAQLLLPLLPQVEAVATDPAILAQYRSEIVIQLGTDSLRLF